MRMFNARQDLNVFEHIVQFAFTLTFVHWRWISITFSTSCALFYITHTIFLMLDSVHFTLSISFALHCYTLTTFSTLHRFSIALDAFLTRHSHPICQSLSRDSCFTSVLRFLTSAMIECRVIMVHFPHVYVQMVLRCTCSSIDTAFINWWLRQRMRRILVRLSCCHTFQCSTNADPNFHTYQCQHMRLSKGKSCRYRQAVSTSTACPTYSRFHSCTAARPLELDGDISLFRPCFSACYRIAGLHGLTPSSTSKCAPDASKQI